MVYVGAWNGMVPASVSFTDDDHLTFCREDLKLQCVGPIPFTREGEDIVVDHMADGLRWVYRLRDDGAINAIWQRWNGNSGYDQLATAVLRRR